MKYINENVIFSENEYEQLDFIKGRVRKYFKQRKKTILMSLLLVVFVFLFQFILFIMLPVIIIIFIQKLKKSRKYVKEHPEIRQEYLTKGPLNPKVAYCSIILPLVLKKILPNATFSDNGNLCLLKADMLYGAVPRGDTPYTIWGFDINDNNIPISISRVHIMQEDKYTDSDGIEKTIMVSKFLGIAYSFPIQKKVDGEIRIFSTKTVMDKEFVGKYKEDTKNWIKDGWKKVDIESIYFNENFEVYGKNEIDVFNFFDHIMIEQFEKLRNKYNNFGCCVRNNKLIIAVKQNDDILNIPDKLETFENLTFENEQKKITDIINSAIELYNIVNNIESEVR